MKRLVLGGIKSGKSLYAERLAAEYLNSANVGVVATAEALDEEMRTRIQKHIEQRPENWKVVEAPVDLVGAIQQFEQDDTVDVILVDCLTLWLTNLLCKPECARDMSDRTADFLACVDAAIKPIILVSNETNMGLIGMDELTRKFCDVAGKLHQELAKVCDHVDLVVAGLPMSVK